jgi:predicted kinase
VRALIREDRVKRAQATLEAKLMEGLNSGPAVVADDAYWEALKREVQARIAKHRRKRSR